MDSHTNALAERIEKGSLRALHGSSGLTDFCSNDYLGLASGNILMELFKQSLLEEPDLYTGAGSARLILGDYPELNKLEQTIAQFHRAPAALIFTSGYQANLGLMQCIAKRGDTIFYDAHCHASIRDGIRLSHAKAYSFRHNDVQDLKVRLKNASGQVYVVTEAIFSMGGDMAPLTDLASLSAEKDIRLVVDEAHSAGLYGDNGEGLVASLGIQQHVFATTVTYGKAFGCQGAAVLCSELFREYLINFCRPFIYTTAASPVLTRMIQCAYQLIPGLKKERKQVQQLSHLFDNQIKYKTPLVTGTAIKSLIVPGNQSVKSVAEKISQSGFQVKPILYPTVSEGTERIRITLHSFNSRTDLEQLIHCIPSNLKSG